MSFSAGSSSDLDLKAREFRADLDYFITFFRHNEQFVPQGARFTLIMAASVEALRGLDNVAKAKELFFQGTITLHMMQRYLEAVMMFELWNSLRTCEASGQDHSEECQRLKQIVNHNPKLFANQGTRDQVFKSDSECLSTPRSGTCSRDWDRARGILNDRMRLMKIRFQDVIRVRLRQYFSQRPALTAGDLSSTTYKREELVAAMSLLQRNLLLEINTRNRQLAEQLTTFMSAEMAARFQTDLMGEQERLASVESNLKQVLAQAQAKMEAITSMPRGLNEEEVRGVIRAEREQEERTRLWNDTFVGNGDAANDTAEALDRRVRNLEQRQQVDDALHVDTALMRVDEVKRELDQAFGVMSELVGVMEQHQTRIADLSDRMKSELETKVALLSEQLRLSRSQNAHVQSEADARLAALEQRMLEQETLTSDQGQLIAKGAEQTERLQSELALTQDKVRRLDHFRARMLSLLAGVMFLGILAVLCELLPVPEPAYFPT